MATKKMAPEILGLTYYDYFVERRKLCWTRIASRPPEGQPHLLDGIIDVEFGDLLRASDDLEVSGAIQKVHSGEGWPERAFVCACGGADRPVVSAAGDSS